MGSVGRAVASQVSPPGKSLCYVLEQDILSAA